jgi:hypothetical protein
MKLIVFLISFIAAAWVFYDARSRGKGIVVAFLWCLGAQVLLIVFLPLWLFVRPERYPNIVIVERPRHCPYCGK